MIVETDGRALVLFGGVALGLLLVMRFTRPLLFTSPPGEDRSGEWRELSGIERLWWSAYLCAIMLILAFGMGKALRLL